MADTVVIDLDEDDWTELPDVPSFTCQNITRSDVMRFAHSAAKPAADFEGYDLIPKAVVNRISTGTPWIYTQSRNAQVAFTEDDR